MDEDAKMIVLMLQALNVCHGSRNLTFQVWGIHNIVQRLLTALKRLAHPPPSLVYTIHFLSPFSISFDQVQL
jgi:hypothetical protein